MTNRYKQSRNEPHEGQHPFAESMPPPDAPRRPKTEKHAQAARKGGKYDERGRKDASAFKNDISKRELSQAPENAAAVSSSTDARGGENLKYKYTYTYTRTTCETHAASDRNAADVIRPGIRQQQKSGSSNTFAISLNRFICTKFFLSVPQI